LYKIGRKENDFVILKFYKLKLNFFAAASSPATNHTMNIQTWWYTTDKQMSVIKIISSHSVSWSITSVNWLLQVIIAWKESERVRFYVLLDT